MAQNQCTERSDPPTAVPAESKTGATAPEEVRFPHLVKTTSGPTPADGKRPFRFYDNRQKYLTFVNTCNEKWVIADRAGKELVNVEPSPPAMRLFDAGMGDGTVLMMLMRGFHRSFPTVPLLVVAKEISLEDVRLGLEKIPDRLAEHPATVIVVTNLYYSEAPQLMPRSLTAAAALNWDEVALEGSSAQDYSEQIRNLMPRLSAGWKVTASEKTGNPLYVRPSVLVIYRKDQRFALDHVLPRPGRVEGNYDLIVASQPYRSRMSDGFKVKNVLGPLAERLAPGGRMLVVHSSGGDPGMEIIHGIWPDEDPFRSDRTSLMRATKLFLGRASSNFQFSSMSKKASTLRYWMHSLPSEIGANIGTSTLFAAWNAAIYVAQIDDEQLSQAMSSGAYLNVTQDVLRKHGGLWFNAEAFVIGRKRA